MTRQDSVAAFEAHAGPGPDAVRRALRGPPGRVALRLASPAVAARRRVALALLGQAGGGCGGAVLESADGELLLTEAVGADGARVAGLLERLLGVAPACLPLPDAVATLLAMPGLAPADAAAAAPPSAAGIEGLADAAPLPALLRRDGVLHLATGEAQRLAFLRLRLPAQAIAPCLGPAAIDHDLARHARDRARGRLLAELADPARRDALLGAMPSVPLLIDLPAALLPDADAAPPGQASAATALIATLSVAEAMADDLAGRRAALRALGWGLAARGLDAATLTLLTPDALPVDLLLLRWSPDLAGRAAAAALRRTDPGRLVLTGCDGAAALEWGVSLGIVHFAGSWIDAVMAARRMAACPGAGACTRADCATRGRAAAAASRAGCTALPLLAALLPPGRQAA